MPSSESHIVPECRVCTRRWVMEGHPSASCSGMAVITCECGADDTAGIREELSIQLIRMRSPATPGAATGAPPKTPGYPFECKKVVEVVAMGLLSVLATKHLGNVAGTGRQEDPLLPHPLPVRPQAAPGLSREVVVTLSILVNAARPRVRKRVGAQKPSLMAMGPSSLVR